MKSTLLIWVLIYYKNRIVFLTKRFWQDVTGSELDRRLSLLITWIPLIGPENRPSPMGTGTVAQDRSSWSGSRLSVFSTWQIKKKNFKKIFFKKFAHRSFPLSLSTFSIALSFSLSFSIHPRSPPYPILLLWLL